MLRVQRSVKIRFKKSSAIELPVINLDQLVGEKNQNKERHGPLLPNTVRAIFCGPSNCGKTNAILSLIMHPNGLKFENIYLYSKSLYQPKYKFLKDLLQPIENVNYFEFNDREEVVNVDQALPNSIMIFDDVACEKQDNMKAYFCMGRHKLVDSFYLCQTYVAIPKHLIRDNVNLIVLFRQDEINLRHVYDEHVNTDMRYEEFKNLCRECWNDGHGFLVINKDSKLNNGRYRRGFDQFAINKDGKEKI